MEETFQYFRHLPFWELTAVFASLLYVLLAAKENIWCWPAALISTLIYTVIFYDVYLWMDSLLQVYYLLMALYGWFMWRKSPNDNKKLSIQSWSLIQHGKFIFPLAFLALLLGWLMARYTPTDFPYLDSLTTVYAVFATYLVTQKVLENWLYWIVIDAVSIYLYLEKGLLPTAVLFSLYVVIAMFGYLQWQSSYNKRRSKLLATE